MTDLKLLAEKEAARIKKELDELQAVIGSSPEGHLKCSKRGGRRYYYTVSSENGIRRAKYISADKMDLARRLVIRDISAEKLKLLKKDLDLLNDLIGGYTSDPDRLASKKINPDHLMLIKDAFSNNKDAVNKWQSSPFDKNDRLSESLIQRTLSGVMVRSKSEAIIADQLYQRHIPFRYEECRMMNGQEYCPDFTILDPKTLKEYVWEHFGLMSSEAYRASVFRKLAVYSENGLMLDENLIATFEWENAPLNPVYVSSLIDHFFDL